MIVAAIVKPGARAVARGLFGDPVHGQRKVSAGCGRCLPRSTPRRPRVRPGKGCTARRARPAAGAAVFLLFGRAFKRPAAKPLPRRRGRGGAGAGVAMVWISGSRAARLWARGMQAESASAAAAASASRRRGGVFHGGSSRRSRVYSGAAQGAVCPRASASSATVWPPLSLPLMSASATGSSSVLRMVRRSSRAPNRVEVALTMAASAAGAVGKFEAAGLQAGAVFFQHQGGDFFKVRLRKRAEGDDLVDTAEEFRPPGTPAKPSCSCPRGLLRRAVEAGEAGAVGGTGVGGHADDRVEKSTVRPCASLILPSSRICSRMFITSGCAFSISSNSTTL